ncbi:hypothetical protein D3C81_1250460 [compost metagenome]
MLGQLNGLNSCRAWLARHQSGLGCSSISRSLITAIELGFARYRVMKVDALGIECGGIRQQTIFEEKSPTADRQNRAQQSAVAMGAIPHDYRRRLFALHQRQGPQADPGQLQTQQQTKENAFVLALDPSLLALLFEQVRPIDTFENARQLPRSRPGHPAGYYHFASEFGLIEQTLEIETLVLGQREEQHTAR